MILRIDLDLVEFSVHVEKRSLERLKTAFLEAQRRTRALDKVEYPTVYSGLNGNTPSIPTETEINYEALDLDMIGQNFAVVRTIGESDASLRERIRAVIHGYHDRSLTMFVDM